MAKDPTTESHVAESRARIAKAAPETVETERHIERTQRALERSRKFLDGARDPLQLAGLLRAATEDGPSAAPERRSLRKATRKPAPKRPR